MKKKIIHLVTHPLFSGSAVMIIGTNLNNVLSYLFQLFMGRMLAPSAYGEMASLLSLFILVSTVPSSLNLAIVKFVTATKDSRSLSAFFSTILALSAALGGLICIFVLAFSNSLSSFLKLSSVVPVYLVAVSLVFLLPSIVFKSALQGLIKFTSYILNILAESGSKLFFAILFVWLGWSVTGSIAGILVATLIGLVIGYLFVAPSIRIELPRRIPLRDFFYYSLPVLIYSLASTSLFTTDQILVKHFLSPIDAGTYAALSTMGKIIVFGAGPVSGVMFPLVSKRHSSQEKYGRIFWYGFALTAAICLAVLFVYLLFPQFAVSLLYGRRYLQAAHLLFPFGVFITLFALSTYLIGFFLSINYTKIVVISILAALAQISGIFLFHASISEIINVSILACLVMFLTLLSTLKIKAGKIRA